MKGQRISSHQALLLIVTLSLTLVFQPVFRELMLRDGNGAWLPMTAATGASIIALAIVLNLAQRFPDKSLVQYLPKVWGYVLGYPMAVLFLSVFLAKATINVRNLADFFITSALPETPISAVILLILILVASAVLAGLEGIVRFNELVVPAVLAVFILVGVLALRHANPWFMLPLFERGFDGMLQSFMTSSSYLTEAVFLLLIFPAIVDTKGLKGRALGLLGFSGFIFIAVYVSMVTFFGATFGAAFTWPYLEMTRSIAMGVERAEAILMVFWLLAAYVKISFFIYLFAHGMSQLIPKLPAVWIGLGVLPLVFYLSLLPPNVPVAEMTHSMLSQGALLVQVGIPVATLGLVILQSRGGKRHARRKA